MTLELAPPKAAASNEDGGGRKDLVGPKEAKGEDRLGCKLPNAILQERCQVDLVRDPHLQVVLLGLPSRFSLKVNLISLQ